MKEQNIKNNTTVQLVTATPSSILLVNERDMNISHAEGRKLIEKII
jgi:Fe-S cluster biosynthesis and repair protein YggX